MLATPVLIADRNTYDVPAVQTSVYTADVIVYLIEIANPTGSPINFTAWDLGSPQRIWIPQQTVQPGSMLTYVSDKGRKIIGGFQWQAGGAGLVGSVVAKQAA